MRTVIVLTVTLGLLAACSREREKPAAVVPSAKTDVAPAAETAKDATEVVAYYFHGTVRCETCLRIEKEARDFIHRRFASEVASERLSFRAVNYDLPENAHFSKDYKLPCPSLVLVRREGAKDQEWKVLGQTWTLVSIPPKLDKYIEAEVVGFLEGSPAAAVGAPAAEGSGQSTDGGVGRRVGSLAEVEQLSGELNAVLVFVPAKDREPTASVLAAIHGARQTLEARFGIRIGLFTLGPSSHDYDDVAAKVSLPAVVPIVKTGARGYVSGDLVEEKIVEGFLGTVAAGGCCPLGYPSEQ